MQKVLLEQQHVDVILTALEKHAMAASDVGKKWPELNETCEAVFHRAMQVRGVFEAMASDKMYLISQKEELPSKVEEDD